MFNCPNEFTITLFPWIPCSDATYRVPHKWKYEKFLLIYLPLHHDISDGRRGGKRVFLFKKKKEVENPRPTRQRIKFCKDFPVLLDRKHRIYWLVCAAYTVPGRR